MRDVEWYQQLLGLVAPWTVSRVELAVETERVDIWAEHAADVRWPCPECEMTLSVYDHAEERAWRHLDSFGSAIATSFRLSPDELKPTRTALCNDFFAPACG